MIAFQVLDRVQSLASVEALAADPGAFSAALAPELPDGVTAEAIAARDAALRDALQRIDDLASRVMRIRLDHALAHDTTIAAPTRKVFAQTIASYAGRLPLLGDRVRDLAVRGRAPDPDRTADAVVEAARSTLALRDALASFVLELARDGATRALPEVERRARDRTRDDAQRTRDSGLRRELEAIAGTPARITEAPLAGRLATWPDQLDDPAPEAEVTFADMIEID
jgi:hypothetical protein